MGFLSLVIFKEATSSVGVVKANRSANENKNKKKYKTRMQFAGLILMISQIVLYIGVCIVRECTYVRMCVCGCDCECCVH